MIKKSIFVTEPSLPPLESFMPYLEDIWESKNLTNGAKFHQELEEELCEYLGVKHISLFTNGTIALVTALQSLRITGEVITTPYSFVATSHSLLWNGIKPIFVDIDPLTLNIDHRKIEAAITPQTTAILAVHCYGIPCNIEEIQKIADIYNLKVIYDAAHAFGVKKNQRSILLDGDLSVLSFHATKVFNTFEGGAIICPDKRTKQRIDHLKNFGFVDEVTVTATGINGKMSEFNAALGLLQLKHINDNIENRKRCYIAYHEAIKSIPGISCMQIQSDLDYNYSYFPILIDSKYPISRDEVYNNLRNEGVYARRYFYPLITDFSMYRGLPSANPSNLVNAKAASNQIICLPMHAQLTTNDIARVIHVLASPF
jgi:dTDP-4-amino-4,6-dideoxygalactose transaminase